MCTICDSYPNALRSVIGIRLPPQSLKATCPKCGNFKLFPTDIFDKAILKVGGKNGKKVANPGKLKKLPPKDKSPGININFETLLPKTGLSNLRIIIGGEKEKRAA